MTHSARLSALAHPSLGFVRQIKIAQEAFAALSFASAWVDCGPEALPVSGCGLSRKHALDTMMMEAVERNSSVYLGSEPPTVSAVSLLNDRRREITSSQVYLGYPDCSGRFALDSSGCAAGDTLNDAAFRALLELFERHCFYRWWTGRRKCFGLRYDDDSLLNVISDALQVEHRILRFLDISDRSEIPVIVALNAKQDGSCIYIGCAAALDQTTAARRAAIESLSFWFWGKVSADPLSRQAWLNEATFNNQVWLASSEDRPMTSSNNVPTLAALLDKCRTLGIDPYLLNLTRPYFQIPVVRVIADTLDATPPGDEDILYPSPL